jgi:hypothetical protein
MENISTENKEANKVYNACHLEIGDRFYKLGDKNKTIYQMVEGEQSEGFNQPTKYYCIAVTSLNSRFDCKVKIDPLKQLVFLRATVNTGI